MSVSAAERPLPEAGAAPAPPPGAVDFDLHGIVSLRLLDASPADVAAVARQVGAPRGRLEREPDLVVRFVDRLPRSGLRHVGWREAAFSEDGFFVYRRRGRGEALARIPFDRVGGPCEIVCESGVASVPLLIPILNLAALAHGVVAVHAAAFTYRGTGALVAGWAKGGKTEALLAFMAHGARYVGDEWVYVGAGGTRLHGLPEPVTLWDWHLPDLPGIRRGLGRNARARLRAIRLARSLAHALPERRTPDGLERLDRLAERQLFVRARPDELFGPDACALEGSFDRLFLLVSHDSPEVAVEPVDPEEVALRMVFSGHHERLELLAHYLRFRFAFPQAQNALLERAEELERDLIRRAFAGKEAYAVHHPFPAPIPALFDAMAPLLEGGR
jgi:hypothetical protein